MSKFIGCSEDIYGNNTYVSKIGEEIEFSSDEKNAILLTADDKKVINKFLNKNHRKHPKYVKLEDLNFISYTTNIVLEDYEHDFFKDFAKYARKEDDMSLECISIAKNGVEGINTFMDFGVKVANILIEKYNLKKKEQI
jgi:hypothetical protein